MTIRLLQDTRIAGTAYAADSVLRLDSGLESELVMYNRAVPLGEGGAADRSLNRLVIVSDSMTARNNKEYSINTAVAAGGVATITTASTHNALPGETAIIHGLNSGYYNGTFVISTVPSTTTFTFAIDKRAPSAATTGDHSPSVIMVEQKADHWYRFAESLAGKEYGLIANAGRGSVLSAYTEANFGQDVMSHRPKCVVLMVSLNDAKGEVATAVSLARYVRLVERILGEGATPVMILPTPYGGSFNTSANNAAEFALMKGAKAIARQYQIPYVDAYDLIVDKSSADAAPKSGYVDTDGLHLSGPGSKAIGAALYPILDSLGLGRPMLQINTLYDDQGVTGSTNILANSGLAGTDGSKSGSASGNVATGWTLTRNSNQTGVAGSKGTAGSLGVSQIVTVSDTGGTVTTSDGFSLDSEALTSRITAGKLLRVGCRIDLDMDDVYRLEAGLLLTPTGGQVGYVYAWSNFVSTSPMPSGENSLYMVSEPFRVPAGATYSAAIFRIRLYQTAAAAYGTAEVSQPFVWMDDE